MSGFIEPIARAFSEALTPVQVGFNSPAEMEAFLARYGWEVSVGAGDMDAISAAFAVEPLVVAVLENLDELISGTNADRLRAAVALLEAAKNAAEQLGNLSPSGAGGLAAPLNQTGFWTELSELLVEDLIVSYLERRQPVIFGLLHFAGVIRFEPTSPAGPNRIPFTRSRIHWDKLPDLLTRPGETVNELYKWDVSGQQFDYEGFLRTFERILLAFRVYAAVAAPRERLATAYLNPANVVAHNIHELEAPLIDTYVPGENAWWKVGAVLLPIPDPPKSGNRPTGILISPLLQGNLTLSVHLAPGIALKFSAGMDASSSIAAMIYPGRASLDTNLSSAAIDASVELSGRPPEPFLLVGSRDSHRLELDGFRVILGFTGTIGDPEIYFGVGTGDADSKLRLKVVFGDDGDAFVQKLAPPEGLQVEVGGNFLWSSKRGVSFEGSAAIDFVKHLHLALGPISIETLYIHAGAGTQGVNLDLGVGLKATLGPLVAVVENIGVRAALVPVNDHRGTFDNLDLKFGFKPPNGVGISVDAGVVKGGGYLFFDFEKEEYAGALEFTFSKVIRLTAIGLLTTRMPDGSKGFSLLIIITAEFGSGIQLGYGFTLLGVGGLIGLNRSMMLEPLAQGVRTGAVNTILFPRDVVANAPRILSDLRTIFPPREGVFLIGPMAKLGWGTPTLISLSLGIIIEIPGNIAIVGVLRVALPTADKAILVIQVSFVGAIEFDRKRVWFFAGLFESRVLFITLEGEMGLLVAFGDDANFVVTCGGFNPCFDPPPLPFPSPARIALNILNTSAARIRAMVYFAVTTNTVQFGAHAELFFGFDAVNIQGHIGFDALFRFSPFYFIIQISASVSVTVFGISLLSIRLEFSLEGPTPWRAKGSATISLLFFEVSADFDITWGEARETTLPPVAVMPLLVAELDKLDNWRAVLPASNNLLVTLRKLEDAPGSLVLHPVGALHVSQKVVPLDLTLDKVGNQTPSDAKRFAIGVAPSGLEKKSDLMEKFALAQFQTMDDGRKLSRPPFEDQHGGLALAPHGEQLSTSRAVTRTVRYEDIVIDTNYRRFAKRFSETGSALFAHFLGGSAAAKSALSRHEREQLQPFAAKVAVAEMTYAVAYQSTNRPVSAGAAAFASEALAHEFLRSRARQDPDAVNQLHVIPQYEVA